MYPRIMIEIASTHWAITEDALRGIVKAAESSISPEDRLRFHFANKETREAVFAALGEPREDGNEYTAINGSIGTLLLDGPIVPRSSSIRKTSGLVSIEMATKEFLDLEADESIDQIVLFMDTPGGAVKGVSEFARLIANSSKPTTAFVFGMAASAGYWIASAADRIISVDTGIVGSIGVVQTVRLNDRNEFVEIVSRQSPNKRIDPATKDGRRKIETLLSELADVFIEAIAENRNVTPETVIEKFGKGGVFAAAKAKEVGMIDGISDLSALMSELKNGSLPDYGMPAALLEEDLEPEAEFEPTAGATPFKNLPIVDRPWDSGAADRRVRSFTGSTEKPSGRYRDAFFWYDSAKADKFGSYKLPFADVVGGKLVAIRRGVFAANGAMKGARGGVQIPQKDRGAVQSHIDRYMSKIEKMDKKEKSKMDLKTLIEEHPEIKAELDAIEAAAKKSGREEMIALHSEVSKFIGNSEYPASVDALAKAVLSGEESLDKLRGAVSAIDSVRASDSEETAEEELEEIPDTPPEEPPALSADGIIRTEDDYQAAIASIRPEA